MSPVRSQIVEYSFRFLTASYAFALVWVKFGDAYLPIRKEVYHGDQRKRASLIITLHEST